MSDPVIKSIIMINMIIGVSFAVCYFYQAVYVFIPFLKRKEAHKPERKHRFAVLIAARNEERVIGQLIESIHNQNYPKDLIDIFVAADNCTDQTANRAWEAGAIVKERNNPWLVGKGYALHWLLNEMRAEGLWKKYDAYLVLDADNLLDEGFITAMNQTLSDGYEVSTSYRNSKNFGDNWLSAGYSTWFLREARFLNDSRNRIHASCAVSGTGFCFTRKILEKYNGWNFFLLTEDIQFSMQCAVDGIRIGYCDDAVLYDEQPTDFGQSWRQRLRWSKGNLQVLKHYKSSLVRGIVKGSYPCFDLFMNLAPAVVFTIVSVLLNSFGLVYGFAAGEAAEIGRLILEGFCSGYGTMYLIGLVTILSEWKQIHCENWKKVLYTFTFPVFVATYIPITLTALVKKVEWLPIEHKEAKTLKQVRSMEKVG